jgi:hypothetical protein
MAPPQLRSPVIEKNRQGGICHLLNLQEDNMRFILLALLLYIYLAIGAFIFQAIEEVGETKMRKDFETLYNEFIQNLTQCYDVPILEKDEKRTFGFGLDTSQGSESVVVSGVDDLVDKISGGNVDVFSSGSGYYGGNGHNNRSGYSNTGDFKAVSTLLFQSSSISSLSQSSLAGRVINESGSVSQISDSSESRSRLRQTEGSGGRDSSRTHHQPFLITLDGLHELLFAYGNATQAGVLWKRKRWDWVGSFHFAWTIVSTIGK